MLIYRRDQHHLVCVKRRKFQGILVHIRPDQSHVKGTAQQPLHDSLTVALKYMKLGGRPYRPKRRQYLRQHVSGRDGGRADADHFLILIAPAAHQVVTQIHNIAGTFVQLLSAWRHLHRFGGAHDQTGLKFFLQLPHVRTDGRLRQIEFFCRLCKAFILHNSAE